MGSQTVSAKQVTLLYLRVLILCKTSPSLLVASLPQKRSYTAWQISGSEDLFVPPGFVFRNKRQKDLIRVWSHRDVI